MSDRLNDLGQPIGAPLDVTMPRPRPTGRALHGRFCDVMPTVPADHAGGLHDAFAADHEGRDWTYLPYGPFPDAVAFRTWLEDACRGGDPMFHTILVSGRPAGLASLMRIDPANGVIEVGHIHYAPALQRAPAATEAMFLLMSHAFDDLGYRRYEWKCDALNAPSRRAAERLGFTYEGTFRKATHYKGRNRDTAWYSIIDEEWPALRERFQTWLDPANFDASGRQKKPLRG